MKIEMTREQATAVHYALLLHTKRRFYFFPIKPGKTYPRSDF